MKFEAKRAKSIIRKCRQDFCGVWILDSKMRVRIRLSGYWSRDGIRGDIFHLGAEAFIIAGRREDFPSSGNVRLLYSSVCGGREDNGKKIKTAMEDVLFDMKDYLHDEMGISIEEGEGEEEEEVLEKIRKAGYLVIGEAE